MPASPKATVVGLGAAAVVTIAVFLVPAIVLTDYFGQVSERQQLRDATAAAVSALRLRGVETGTLPEASVTPLGETSFQLFPVTGPLTAWDGQSIPLHQQPREAIVWIAGPSTRTTPIQPNDFAADDTALSDVVGAAGSRGIPVAFADGTVWMMRETTPATAIRPFLTRNTLVKLKRDDWLAPFQLRDR